MVTKTICLFAVLRFPGRQRWRNLRVSRLRLQTLEELRHQGEERFLECAESVGADLVRRVQRPPGGLRQDIRAVRSWHLR